LSPPDDLAERFAALTRPPLTADPHTSCVTTALVDGTKMTDEALARIAGGMSVAP
jgi:hypothetical protein